MEKHTNRQHATQKRDVELLDGRPALTWTTLSRAEKLAHAGAGWSVDHVVRKALAMLEREVYTREEAQA